MGTAAIVVCSIVIAALAAGNILLAVKLCFMRRAARDIENGFINSVQNDTNSRITISCADGAMKSLAASLNGELKIYREARLKYDGGNAEIEEAVTNISHDLRTPLTAISGYLDILETEKLSVHQAHYVEIIRDRVNAMKKLTEELFDYSYAMTVPQEGETLGDVRATLENELLSFYAAFEERNITPKITLPENKVERTLDFFALERVIRNIISNALKYSSGDFEVTLTESGVISFVNAAPSLDALTTAKLFDRFFTVENAKKSTGLGLSIAKRLIVDMGGNISAEYVSGDLIITVELPR